MAGDVREGERAVVVPEEHAPIGLLSVPQVVSASKIDTACPLSVRASSRHRRVPPSGSKGEEVMETQSKKGKQNNQPLPACKGPSTGSFSVSRSVPEATS
jgi:hypothetical protein